MPKLTEISLDYDRTYSTRKAEKRDGYTETDDSITAITAQAVFPIPKKPQAVQTFDELMEMPTPPIHMGEATMGYIKYANDWLPIGDMTASLDAVADRSRREALAHLRIQRQIAIKEASEESHSRMSESFKLLTIALSVIGVMSILIIGIVILARGGAP
jgi:hypothetical protein